MSGLLATFFPYSDLIVFSLLRNIPEVVKNENPGAFIQYEQRQVIHLYIYLRCQSNSCLLFCYQLKLYNKKLVLQPNVLPFGGSTSNFHFYCLTFFQFIAFEFLEKSSGFCYSIVSYSVEVGLAVRKERNIDFAVANSLVSTKSFLHSSRISISTCMLQAHLFLHGC